MEEDTCYQCNNPIDKYGPYETNDGNYVCQSCHTSGPEEDLYMEDTETNNDYTTLHNTNAARDC